MNRSASAAVFTDYAGGIVKEVPNLTGAYLDPTRGTLRVTEVTPADFPPVLDIFQNGVYHLYDYQFFYRNLQTNVKERIGNFMSVPVLARAGRLICSDCRKRISY